jgi:hypothetical protein
MERPQKHGGEPRLGHGSLGYRGRQRTAACCAIGNEKAEIVDGALVGYRNTLTVRPGACRHAVGTARPTRPARPGSPAGDRRAEHGAAGELLGYLPPLDTADPTASQWVGQEATGFPDNWMVGMSFYHNLFAREHNAFVQAFRKQPRATPDGDSRLRDPDEPLCAIIYADVTDDELSCPRTCWGCS